MSVNKDSNDEDDLVVLKGVMPYKSDLQSAYIKPSKQKNC